MRVRGRFPRTPGDNAPAEPWFRRWPGLTIAVASTLYAVVSAVRWLVADSEPITLLFCFPIALLAIAFGLRAGLLAGGAGVLLFAIWVETDGADVSVLGWISRVAPMLLFGALLGDAADRLRASDAERDRLRATAQRHHDAVEFQDGVVQELAAAKWAFEVNQPQRGLEILTHTLIAAQDIVSQMLRDADSDSDAEAGSRPGRRPGHRSTTSGRS